MPKSLIIGRLREIAAQIAEKNGVELVQIEDKGAGKARTICIYIDKPEGVSHEDCAGLSREFGEILDAEDLIETEYTLEVSSPGIERELYSLRDFEKFAGSLAKVKTKTAIEGRKHFRGKILKIEGEEIFFDDKQGGKFSFPYSAVAKANLEYDFEADLKSKK